jgi:hypothetical protein
MRARSHNAAFVECWGVSCRDWRPSPLATLPILLVAAKTGTWRRNFGNSPADRARRKGPGGIIDRARKASGLPYWRCWNIWYGKARHIAPEEYAAVAAALEKKRRDDNRAELQQLWTRLVRLESALAQTDPDFHRPSIDAQDRLGRRSRCAPLA